MLYIKGFLLNLQFFTTIPIRMEIPMDQDHLERAVKTFPLLGLFQGIIYYLLVMVLSQYSPFSTLAIAFAIWVLSIVLTGGIHLDGWMDTSDAFFSHQEVKKRIEIMKDPRTGAFGVLSVIILLAAKFLFIYEILSFTSYESFTTIILIPFFSRTVMGYLLVHVNPVKQEGLASLFHTAVKKRRIPQYMAYWGILLILWTLFDLNTFLFVILTGIGLITYLFIRKKSLKWFGGMTGDVLGASVEGVELFAWMTWWLLLSIAMV